MMIREPVRAGMFYPASAEECRRTAGRLTSAAAAAGLTGRRLYGGIVPHAGWTFSGAVAGTVFATLAQSRRPDVMVLFGAVHYQRGHHAWVFGSGRWETPLGAVEVEARLSERICGHTNLVLDDPNAHEGEHSIEVQLPLLQVALPDCKVVPVLVPPGPAAVEVGQAVAGTIEAYGYDAVVVGSTDLTHYGPSYGMTSHGRGREGIAWAKEVNDRRMIDLILGLDAAGIVPEAGEHQNACGAGAVAATVAAAARLGAREGVLLQHTSSAEIMASAGVEDSVGYAGVVFADQPART